MRDPKSNGHAIDATDARRWWRRWRIALALILSVAVAGFAFAFRFNSLSGTFGGFDDDHFATLMRVDLLLDGQLPLRDFSDYELRGAWPSLSYVLPAWAQRIGGRSLWPEAALTVGILALAHALLFALALAFSRRWSVALFAAGFAIVTTPKLYNYPKVLVLVLGALAIRAAMLTPTWTRLALAAVVTSAGVLFRHDYGVYIVVGTLAALVARDSGQWRLVAERVGSYLAFTTICLLPSAAWVQVYEGIPSYVRRSAATAVLEAQRTELRLPSVNEPTALGDDTIVVLTYFGFWLIVVAAIAVLGSRSVATAVPLTRVERGTAAGLLATVVMVNLLFLRANLTQRFGDAVVPAALLLAWSVGTASAIGSLVIRRAAMGVLWVLLLSLVGASFVWSGAARRLDDAGMLDSWQEVSLRFDEVKKSLRDLPPVAWSQVEIDGSLPTIRYVALCTAPDDHLFVAGYAPEIFVLARRRFAAGQGTVSLGFYTSNEDQRRALDRLSRQSVPVILAEADEFEEGFVSDYPLLARHLLLRYRDAGVIALEGEPRWRVFVDKSRQPTGVDPALGLPCFN